MDLGTTVEHTVHRQTLFALRLAKRPGEVHSKPACHADRPGRAGVANADRESKLVGMPVPWTCDLDRTSRSCRVFCSLQCMACVHWSTQATAAALVHRQMAMRPLWRRSNAEEGHRHWAALCSGELTHTYSGKKDAPPPLSSITEALKKAAKESGKPCPAAALRRAPKGPREGFQLNLGNTFEKKVHLLKPEPYVFRPLEKAYLVK